MLSIERQFVRTERPLYGHLVSLLETAIAKGELPSGTRVPPERTLAQRLKISDARRQRGLPAVPIAVRERTPWQRDQCPRDRRCRNPRAVLLGFMRELEGGAPSAPVEPSDVSRFQQAPTERRPPRQVR